MIFHLYNFETVDSTQEEAKKLLKSLPKGEIGVVSAEEQLGGKGRENRKWISPKGNLYLTFILPVPEERKSDSSTLSLTLAAVVASELQKLSIPLFIKWPNDLLYAGAKEHAKVGGILGEGGEALFLGLGLNVSSSPSLDRPTLYLNALRKEPFDLKFLEEKIVEGFVLAYEKWREGGFKQFFPLWNQCLIHKGGEEMIWKGKRVKFIRGEISGGIVIEDEGVQKLVISGEINS